MNTELLEIYKMICKIDVKLNNLTIGNDVKKQNEDLQKRNTELVLENRKLKEENNTLLNELKG